jgi:hypothetical protein
MLTDIRSRITGNIIAHAVGESAALAWMTSQGVDEATATDCLAQLAADGDAHLVAGQILVVPSTEHYIDPIHHRVQDTRCNCTTIMRPHDGSECARLRAQIAERAQPHHG